jgi:hypothetical protein
VAVTLARALATAALLLAAVPGCRQKPKALLAPLSSPSAPFIDGSRVYVAGAVGTAQPERMALHEVPLAGGQAREVMALPNARVLAVHGGRVFLAEGKEKLVSVGLDAKGRTLYASGYNVTALAHDATHLFFATEDGIVARTPLGGGAPQVLASGLGKALVLALGERDAYVGAWEGGRSTSSGGLARVPKVGGPQAAIVAGVPVGSAAADSSGVYWSEVGGRVLRVATGKVRPELLASGESLASSIALDAAHVYWLDAEDRVRRVAKTGGTASTVAERQGLGRGLALGPGVVAWTMVEVDNGCAADIFKPGALLTAPR